MTNALVEVDMAGPELMGMALSRCCRRYEWYDFPPLFRGSETAF